MLWQVTLIDAAQGIRIAMGIAGSVGLVLSILRKRLRLDGWSSFVHGFFGLVPLVFAGFLGLNGVVGPVFTVNVPIVAIESREGSSERGVILLGNAFAEERDRIRQVPRDPSVWYSSVLRIKLRHGLFGYVVLLDRTWIPSPMHRLLPEVRS